MKESPKEIMARFNFFPDQQDIEAVYASFEELLEYAELDHATDVDLFHMGFNRGAFWMQEKHRELLEILGTDNIEVADRQARKLVQRVRGGKI